MSIPGVILRYLLTYVLLVVVVGRILAFAEVGANAALFFGIIVGAAYWPLLRYGRRNRRYFSSADKIHVIAAMTLIDLAFQALLGNVLLPGSAPSLYAFYSLAIVVWLHGALITLVVQFAGRRLRREGIFSADANSG